MLNVVNTLKSDVVAEGVGRRRVVAAQVLAFPHPAVTKREGFRFGCGVVAGVEEICQADACKPTTSTRDSLRVRRSGLEESLFGNQPRPPVQGLCAVTGAGCSMHLQDTRLRVT